MSTAIPTLGQTPLPREAAALSNVSGHTSDAVYETTLAAGEERVLAVYHLAPVSGPPFQIGYAIATLSGGQWSWTEEGVVNPGAFPAPQSLTDPSVAYDWETGDFLVCAMVWTPNQPTATRHIYLARYSAQSQTFEPWELIASGMNLDKPWIVAGRGFQPAGFAGPQLPIHQEYYITWDGDHAGQQVLKYARSNDGGNTWISSTNNNALTNLDDPDSVITPVFKAAPRVNGSRPLYVLCSDGGPRTLSLVRGDDVTSGPHQGEVQFTRLVDSADQPIEIGLNLADGFLPAPFSDFNQGGPGYDLAVDPSNAAKLYVVAHDTPTASDPNTPPDTDMNVYLRVLTRNGAGKWSVGAPIQVNNDATVFESDQILPTMLVDTAGMVHITFYYMMIGITTMRATSRTHSARGATMYSMRFRRGIN
jgi:hypothetical protein